MLSAARCFAALSMTRPALSAAHWQGDWIPPLLTGGGRYIGTDGCLSDFVNQHDRVLVVCEYFRYWRARLIAFLRLTKHPDIPEFLVAQFQQFINGNRFEPLPVFQ